MEKETGISREESLEIIQSMINKAKDKFSEDGFLYLLWGWAVLFCSVSQFVLIKYVHYEKHYLVWMITWLVVAYQVYYLSQKNRKKNVRTYTDDIVGYVWLTFVIAMFLMGFLFGQLLGREYYKMMSPGFLVLYGIPTFLSGIILRFKPLIIGGISCWLLSIISMFMPSSYQLLFIAAAMLTAWIIPGYLLRRKFKKINA